MTFLAAKSRVSNRGVPPDSFLIQLVDWGRSAADEIFAPNANPRDIYASIRGTMGPWRGLLHRRAVILEVLRVLAGFESAWKWGEGRDVTNSTSVMPETIEAGAWQVSANSRVFGADLRKLSPIDGNEFQREMKANHTLAMEYAARLLRHTIAHNGPVKRHEIDPWLRKDAVAEFERLLA